jgi:hypothetical protein
MRPQYAAVAALLLLCTSLFLSLPPSHPPGTEDWTDRFGYRAFLDRHLSPLLLVGSSMTPSLRENDLRHGVPPSDHRVGDIVVYLYEGTLVAHRIVEIPEEGVVITQGDSPQAWERHRVSRENIIYRVVGVLFGRPPQGG